MLSILAASNDPDVSRTSAIERLPESDTEFALVFLASDRLKLGEIFFRIQPDINRAQILAGQSQRIDLSRIGVSRHGVHTNLPVGCTTLVRYSRL